VEDKTFYSDSQTGHLSEWGAAIAQICDEKGIPQDAMVAVLESALSAAYKKENNRKGHIVRADFQEKTGGAKFWEIYHVVKRDDRDWSKEVPVKEFDKKIIDKTRKVKKWEEEAFEEREQKEEKLLYFRPEREMLLSDAKKFLAKIKENDYLAIPVETPEDFGRIAAQTAKQVVLQKIKEIEKGVIYEEYYNKIGEVLAGTVQRIEGVQVYVDLGKTIALLPRKEQVIGERYEQGQRLKVYVMKVEFESKTSMVIVSRSHPGLVEGLFRLEVPEIFSGSVDVVKVVREPGQRAKIAVMSKEEGVDPVGSCIGQRGTRVQAVTDELRGERVDIIEYSEEPVIFLERALSPAKIKRIDIQKGEMKRAKVYVDRDQQSIAIGRGGQNVRLASRLTGFEIDIEMWEGDAEQPRDSKKDDGKGKEEIEKKKEGKVKKSKPAAKSKKEPKKSAKKKKKE